MSSTNSRQTTIPKFIDNIRNNMLPFLIFMGSCSAHLALQAPYKVNVRTQTWRPSGNFVGSLRLFHSFRKLQFEQYNSSILLIPLCGISSSISRVSPQGVYLGSTESMLRVPKALGRISHIKSTSGLKLLMLVRTNINACIIGVDCQ